MVVTSESSMPFISLCSPDQEKSCFACCPPIRPAGYEHLQHKNIIRRILRENTASFAREERTVRPITGFSCWALGYIDRDFRRVGCLLHPLQNEGKDLRYRVDYDSKCSRESCLEAKTFSELRLRAKKFWLHLADSLDSFSYSSKTSNLLFRMMTWGTSLLDFIYAAEEGRTLTAHTFLMTYPFFSTPLAPKAHAYLIKSLVSLDTLHRLRSSAFRSEFESFSLALRGILAQPSYGGGDITPVHLLSMDRAFLDFLRLFLKVPRMSKSDALGLKARLDQKIEMFNSRLNQ